MVCSYGFAIRAAVRPPLSIRTRLFGRIFYGKPVSTFPENALALERDHASRTATISIGTRVPRTVHFYPVFVELVQIYPSWRGYEYFLVGDQIIVVNPRTLEIVAVLDA